MLNATSGLNFTAFPSQRGVEPTFLLFPSSSEELDDSSTLEGIVSKSSVSMEGRRRWVQPERDQYTGLLPIKTKDYYYWQVLELP